MSDTIQCQNCGKQIPNSAKRCQFCEAAVGDGPDDEMKAFMLGMLGQMDPQTRAALQDAINSSDTAEEFANLILVGSCPKCGSEHTQDCENDSEIDNPLVGRCLDCGCHWCTECGLLLEAATPWCPCWDEDESDLPDL